MNQLEFSNILASLSHRDDYEIWLKTISIEKRDSNTITLLVPSQFQIQRIEEKFLSIVSQAVSKYFNISESDILLSFIVGEKNSTNTQTEPSPFDELPKPSLIASLKNEVSPDSQGNLVDYLNYNRYVYSDFNRIVYKLSKRVIEKIGQINPFYIHSNVGMGKTHLLHSIGNHLKKQFPFLNILYITPNHFVEDYTKSLQTNTMHQFHIKYRSVDVLLMDDIQFFIGKNKSCEEFFHLFNDIYTPNKQMVFCSDRMPSELGGIDERLKSRLTSCVIAEIEDLKEIDKINLMNFYLKEHETILPQNVFDFVISSLPNDVRVITGIIKSIVIFKELYGDEINIDFLKKNIRQLSQNADTITYNPNDILNNISSYSKISISDLKSQKRDKSVSFYRQVAMYLLRERFNMSLTDIGMMLGGKNPSSVHIAISKFQEKLKQDSHMTYLIQQILHPSKQ